VKLTALACGTICADLGLLEDGVISGEQAIIPITAFLIEHPDGGNLVWDTGMNPAVRTRPLDHWGGVAKRVLMPHLGDDEDVVSRLASVGIDAADVDVVVNSHLHNDHCGMNRFFPQARVLVRQRELDHAATLMDRPSSGFVRDDFLGVGQQLQTFDYEDEFDVFGDGCVVLLSTDGHTPGHQCLKVTFTSGKTYVLTGDAIYTEDQLCACRASGITWDETAAVRSVQRLLNLRAAGAHVLIAHDRATWAGLSATAVIHEEA
jgi:glyoxylase-like metal-dependent hydrolase (beta-lactamase superfamily II)